MAAPGSTEKPKSKSRKVDKGPIKLIKTPVDLQRLKLEKLMKNPTKEVVIPDMSKEKSLRPPLEFIRNIWGSSAGAGSGDFHVYRGVRRREYARQKFIKEKAEKEEQDSEYKQRLDRHKKEAEDRTAKNRAKRLKKKQRMKAKRSKTKSGKPTSDNESEDDSEDDDKSGSQNEEKSDSNEVAA